jgi:hypothetical protein
VHVTDNTILLDLHLTCMPLMYKFLLTSKLWTQVREDQGQAFCFTQFAPIQVRGVCVIICVAVVCSLLFWHGDLEVRLSVQVLCAKHLCFTFTFKSFGNMNWRLWFWCQVNQIRCFVTIDLVDANQLRSHFLNYFLNCIYRMDLAWIGERNINGSALMAGQCS